MDKNHVRNQFHQIIIALKLIILRFNGMLTADFFFFLINPTISKGLMSIKRGIVPDRISVRKELQLSRVWRCWLHKTVIHSEEKILLPTS